jgi:hypothetical protein
MKIKSDLESATNNIIFYRAIIKSKVSEQMDASIQANIQNTTYYDLLAIIHSEADRLELSCAHIMNCVKAIETIEQQKET